MSSEQAVAPKNRTSKRKRFFEQFQAFEDEEKNHQTSADLNRIQSEGTSGLNQSLKQRKNKKKEDASERNSAKKHEIEVVSKSRMTRRKKMIEQLQSPEDEEANTVTSITSTSSLSQNEVGPGPSSKRKKNDNEDVTFDDTCIQQNETEVVSKSRMTRRKKMIEQLQSPEDEEDNTVTSITSTSYLSQNEVGPGPSSKRKKNDNEDVTFDDTCIQQNETVVPKSRMTKKKRLIQQVEINSTFGQALYQKTKQGLIQKYEDLGDNTHRCNYCGAYFWMNEALKRKSKGDPITYTGCCQQGEIKVRPTNSAPPFLQSLLDPTNGRESIIFRENIRVYNSMFAFTSMGAKIEHGINVGSGPYVFKICGQVHHLMGSILPLEGECPKFAQLYVYDTHNEVSNRINVIDPTHVNPKIKPAIVEGLIQMFDEINELSKIFRNIRQRFEERLLPSFNLTILDHQPNDSKQYERPLNEEIGGLIVGDIGEFNSNKDLIIQSNDGSLRRISKVHPKYMSLQYPLLFPHGEDGYELGLLLEPTAATCARKRMKLTMIKFVTSQIHDRQDEYSTLLKGGRLFQQYLVDAYATVEEDRLEYFRKNQDKLRSEKCKDIYAAISAGAEDSRVVGKRIILPSSHKGSPRDMINNYQDAMAICRQYGNPDLFITFTCNVKWPEITRYFETHPGYKAEDRPDIISRMFKMKADDMLAYIKSGEPFGPTDADVCTFEFQKRGLPHAHMLFWLKKSFKCYTTADIDSIISAELPDKKVNPKLFEIVSQFMIHGPCGQINTNSPCMRDGKCSKFFPKPYNTDTSFDAMKPPIYRRRDDSEKFVIKNGVHIGNNFVVPYNPNLLLKYNAHINVESCSQSMLIKYLFKYMNKGPDRARILLNENKNDEIQTYLNCRYLTPHESVWRLFEYPIHSRHPAVQLLQIHLPSEQNVVFKESECLQNVLQNPNIENTMLTAWFKTNTTYEEARQLTYAEFPTKFVWNTSQKYWSPRKQYETIGRIVNVHPMAGELYYMRILLNIQKGCRNFYELKTVNDVTYPTYQEACQALGLLGDDKEWINALKESSHVGTSSQIRQLFATIIQFGEVGNPQRLFDAHWISMCDDILYKIRTKFRMPNLNIPEAELKNYLLYELEKMFNMSSTPLNKYQLPMPDAEKMLELSNRLIREELDYDCQVLKEQHMNLFSKLNIYQKIVYDEVIKVVDDGNPGAFFVHGSGGTGKTFLWHTIITKLRSDGKIVLAVASSGIASLLLPNGRTAHSRFKIPITANSSTLCEIKKGTELAKLLQKTHLIIWDEAPMCDKYCFESLHRTLCDILSLPNNTENDKPFGGKPILLGGDFRQILPIVSGGTKEQIIKASLNNSYLWPSFKIFHLTENMRLSKIGLSDDEKNKISNFANWILQIGEGRLQSICDTNDNDTSWIEIPNDLLIKYNENPIESIFCATYPNFNSKYNNTEYLRERAIVTPRNMMVHDINNYAINLLPGDKTTYFSFDTISSDSGSNENIDLLYPTEFLSKLDFNGLPSHELTLKPGMPIMILRNLNQTCGLCNGTRLIITKLFERLIEAEILTGNKVGQKIFIPRIVISASESKWPFTFKRRQFPIRPCYAMTINKSQGQSLKQVGVYLPEPVFTHGQLYVAVSRVTSNDGLKILINNQDNVPNKYTKNIVYKDVLQNI